MGYPNIIEASDDPTGDNTPSGSPPLRSLPMPLNSNRDPIWTLNEAETLRLCNLYEREIGTLYPLLDIEEMIEHARYLHRYANTMRAEPHTEATKDTKSCTLKMVLACALMVETCGRSDIAMQLYDSVRPQADSVMHSEMLDIRTLLLPALMVSELVLSGLALIIAGDVSLPLRRRGYGLETNWTRCSYV